VLPTKIKTRQIKLSELYDLIDFDKIYLLDVMKKIGVKESKCAPLLTHDEILLAYNRKDILLWIFVNDNLAGYMWREKRSDCLFGAGIAIKPEYYGSGLSNYIINLTEKIAKESNLTTCRLAVIPINYRVVGAYMKHGYRIVECISAYAGSKYPDTFRCIMEKKLQKINNENILDRCEVLCSDEYKLQEMTDRGYVGVGLIRKNNENLTDNKIVFEKFSE